MISAAGMMEKTGTLGTIISSMGCAACFPVLGTLASSIGLGFLASYEGVLLNKILPVFALFALILCSYQWGKNGRHIRGFLSTLGPVAVLLTLYPLWSYGWSTYLFYAGLILMFVMSLFELIRPARSVCATAGDNNG